MLDVKLIMQLSQVAQEQGLVEDFFEMLKEYRDICAKYDVDVEELKATDSFLTKFQAFWMACQAAKLEDKNA